MRKIRVLIVDDSPFSQAVIQKTLPENNFEICGLAKNGQEGLAKYVVLKPDVVIMDITMPHMDGICALKEIRAQDPEAVIVMCTSMGQKSMVVEAIQAGARDFIVKPFEPERVLEAIGKLIAA